MFCSMFRLATMKNFVTIDASRPYIGVTREGMIGGKRIESIPRNICSVVMVHRFAARGKE
jgi:hypothetical protein